MHAYSSSRERKTDPANEPPTHAMVAGENAGAFPAFATALAVVAAGGLGLFKMAKYGSSGRSDA